MAHRPGGSRKRAREDDARIRVVTEKRWYFFGLHLLAHYWRLKRIMLRQALSSIWRARQRGLHFFQYYVNVVYSRIQDSSLPPLL